MVGSLGRCDWEVCLFLFLSPAGFAHFSSRMCNFFTTEIRVFVELDVVSPSSAIFLTAGSYMSGIGFCADSPFRSRVLLAGVVSSGWMLLGKTIKNAARDKSEFGWA